MSKERVYEVAKQVGIDNKELVTMLPKLGIEGKSHMGSLSDEEIEIVLKFYRKGKYADEPRTVGADIKPQHHQAKPQQQTVRPQQQQSQQQAMRPQQQQPQQQAVRPQQQQSQQQAVRPQQQQSQQQAVRPQQQQSQQQAVRPQQQQSQQQTVRPQQQQSQQQTVRPQQQQSQQQAGRPQPYQGSSPQQQQQQPTQQQTARPQQYQGSRPQQQTQQPSQQQAGRPQPYQGSRPQQQYQQTRPQQTVNQSAQSNVNSAGQTIQTQQQGSNTQKPVANATQQSNMRNTANQPVNRTFTNSRFPSNTNSTSTKPQQQGKPQPVKKDNKSQAKNKNDRTKNAYQKEALNTQASVIDEEMDLFIKIPESISVKDLSTLVKKQASDIIKILFMRKIMATANQELTFEIAKVIAEELGFVVDKLLEEDLVEAFFQEEIDSPENMQTRPPVVVVMGHVDHGKTSLLDAIRSSKVAAGEQGGITQHIGASVITLNGQKITFLDTPGHEAFTAMRLRGAMATDIAILVVAADDGVMPQTIEAINHAKAAGVQIIVAINKIDKAGANPDRVKQELVEYQLIAEDWGGETICAEVSALTGLGVDHLLEMILIVAEMEVLKANPNKKARGTVIEAQLDKGRGPVATVLVQNGTLKVGDAIVAGAAYGRIRAMMDDKGRRVKVALPSTPVEVLGLSEVPLAGEAFFTADSEKEARMVSGRVNVKNREKLIGHTPHKVTLDDIFSQIQAGSMKELKIIVKADVQGSVEAVKQSLNKLSNEKVVINVIHGGVGAITESDVMLASASNAIIIGFNVRPENQAKITADAEQIDMRLYRVIYNAIEDIEAAMKGMLDPEYVEKIIGHAVIRQIFKVSGVGSIAGAYVQDGKIVRSAKVRLLRQNIVIYEGTLDSLKRFKDDAKEVATNYECGFMLNKYNDIQEDDIIEAFIMEEIPR